MVDEVNRLPIGRPFVTVGIDVFSRAIPGAVLTLEAPSALSVGLCLGNMVTDKRAYLERLGVDVEWPMAGKPRLTLRTGQPAGEDQAHDHDDDAEDPGENRLG